MSRMFKSIDDTWNVFIGCNFECIYCNARQLARTRLKHIPRYKDGFKPHLVESELKRTFKPGQFIFVAYMGDISFASKEEATIILTKIKHYPKTNFLLCSKAPGCFQRWHLDIPPNVYLGTTLETDKPHSFSTAPHPETRAAWLAAIPHPHKFLSLEPILDFNLNYLLYLVNILKPQIIEVGADNYHNYLPEPSPKKLESLLYHLKHICPTVIEKDGLTRLKESK